MGKQYDLFSLEEFAVEAMVEKGLLPEFPAKALEEAERFETPALPRKDKPFRDLRHLPWVSIDNDDSRDLDQLTATETVQNQDHIYIAVADVAALVRMHSAIDRYANHNTTSVYTPRRLFPMLPLRLSNNLTSLNEHQERSAIVVELHVEASGIFHLAAIYPALVRNQAKLAYNSVAKWFEHNEPLPSLSPEFHNQLSLQDRIAQRIAAHRAKRGALAFAEIELQAMIVQSNAIRLEKRRQNRANSLIENFMIAANVGVTRYFKEWNIPELRRVVRIPKRWNRIVQLARTLGGRLPSQPNSLALREFLLEQQGKRPDQFEDLSLAVIKLIGRGEYLVGLPGKPVPGHFDLALTDYAHTTAPNRRFPDLVMQRLLKSRLFGEAIPYSRRDLVAIAKNCTQREGDATKVERRLIKSAAALSLADRIQEKFSGMVTGASPKGTWVRLYDPPVEGRITQNCADVDVGDKVDVELIRVDVRQGHIDFRRIC